MAEWRRQERIGSGPIGTGSSFDVSGHPVGEHLRALGKLRDAHPALSTGASAVRLSSGGLLAVSRFDAAARREYVAVFNNGASAGTAAFTTATPSSAWSTLLGSAASVRSDASGRISMTVPPLSAVLLRAETAFPVRAPAAPRLTAGPDDFTELQRVQATVSGTAPVSVSFALRRATGGWHLLAADDSPPYRAFIDPRKLRRNERVHLVAIVRAAAGRTVVSPVVPFVVRRA